MNRPPPETEDYEPVDPACRPTTARLQLLLDGDANADEFESDPHTVTCRACRERVRAARLVLAAMAVPAVPIVPGGLTSSILAGVRVERRGRVRRQVFAAVGGFAIAATVAIVVWVSWPAPPTQSETPQSHEIVQVPPPVLPPQTPQTVPIPEPQPVRIGEELAKGGQVLRDSTRPILDPATAAPQVFASLANTLFRPVAPPLINRDPLGQSLAELPDVAKAGLEPVAGTARKGFNRLLRDVGAIQPSGSNKPDS